MRGVYISTLYTYPARRGLLGAGDELPASLEVLALYSLRPSPWVPVSSGQMIFMWSLPFFPRKFSRLSRTL